MIPRTVRPVPRVRALAAAAAFLLGCGGREAVPAARPAGDAPPPAAAPAAAAPAPEAPVPRIVFLGTSLTAGYGLPDPALAYPSLLQHRLDSLGLKYRTVNAGVSGETSAGALRRIDWVLKEHADVLVLETGANDGLRGLDPDTLRANLQAIIDRARRQQPAPAIVLVGMKSLPNLGAQYSRRFEAVYPAVAKANRLPLVPFLLEGVAGSERLNQADGVHPTAEGQRLAADNVWKVLAPIVGAR